MPNVLSVLTSFDMSAIRDALFGIDARRLVDMRYDLAHAFVQHLGTMRGDQHRPNRSERRKALKRLVRKAVDLRGEVETNLPMLAEEHYAAHFFGAEGALPSNFTSDYGGLIDAAAQLERIATTILSVPPIGIGSTTSKYVEGLPSERLANPGTWARVAFARRITIIYQDYTGDVPGVGNDLPGPYQRMVSLASGAFNRAYREIGRPFGKYRAPSAADQRRACRMVNA